MRLEKKYKNKKLKIGYMSSAINCTFGMYNTLYDFVVINGSSLGDFTYIADGTSISRATIGKFCSIGPCCKMGKGRHPSSMFVSTHPIFFSIFNQSQISFADKNYFDEYKSIVIGNDVWIGSNVIIADGIKIGDGVIVATSSVVTKDVPPYAIVGGVPAKIIKYRFSENEVERLLQLKWWDMDKDYLQSNFQKFHNIEFFLNEFREHRKDNPRETLPFAPHNIDQKIEGGLRKEGVLKYSFSQKPLISIITVVLNGAKTLEQTIASVLSQTYDNVEYIIVDGGSTDGTIDIIKKYEERIDYWISEPDEGIYDAMNKGLMLCSGDFIGIINADDYYVPDALQEVAESISSEGADIIYGNMRLIASEGGEVLQYRRASHQKLIFGMSLNHPATFVSKELYKEGLFDTAYKLAADYDFLLRQKIHGASFQHIAKTLAVMRNDGASKTFAILTSKEERAIKKKYLSRIVFLLTEAARKVSAFVKGQ